MPIASPPLLIVAATANATIPSALLDAYPDAELVLRLDSERLRASSLAVGVFAPSDRSAIHAFAAATRTAGAAALAVAAGARDVVIGPLALPERIGCGACAVDRMMGAAAGTGLEPDRGEASPEALRHAARTLVEELRTLRQSGTAASQLIDHILVVDPQTGDRALHRVVGPGAEHHQQPRGEQQQREAPARKPAAGDGPGLDFAGQGNLDSRWRGRAGR